MDPAIATAAVFINCRLIIALSFAMKLTYWSVVGIFGLISFSAWSVGRKRYWKPTPKNVYGFIRGI
jgi:hypothetical protein